MSTMSYNIKFYNSNSIFNIMREKYNLQCIHNSNIEEKYKKFNNIILKNQLINYYNYGLIFIIMITIPQILLYL